MPKNVRLRLGERLRALRMAQNLTQDAFARRAGVSTKYLQNLEGKTPKRATIESLEKLAKGADMPLWKLLKFDE